MISISRNGNIFMKKFRFLHAFQCRLNNCFFFVLFFFFLFFFRKYLIDILVIKNKASFFICAQIIYRSITSSLSSFLGRRFNFSWQVIWTRNSGSRPCLLRLSYPVSAFPLEYCVVPIRTWRDSR